MWRPRTYQEIESAVPNSLQESHVLEFKREFSKASDTAGDMAAMTLSGGEIVYGIDEQGTHVAQAVTPVKLANARERLQQIANTSVFPPVAISVTLIESSQGASDGAVVLEVPPSPLAPHMANDRYPARSGTTTRYLADAEVERLHLQRQEYTESAFSRTPLADYTPPVGGFSPGSGLGGIGTLRIVVQPLISIRHPLGAAVGDELQAATVRASETLDGLLKPHFSSRIIDHVHGEWKPRGTMGWAAGWASDSELELRTATSGAAVYAHDGTFSFESSVHLVPSAGERYAYEHVWTVEVIATLALAAEFLRSIPGVSFVHVDVSISNLDGATRQPIPERVIVRERRPIADGNYVESSTLPVGRVAEEPHQVAGELLDRLYVSFLNPGEDVIAEVLS